jgi:hypothetical protein
MLVAAADEADRFKLDYPTWGYRALQAIRNLPIDKPVAQVAGQRAGRHIDAAYKGAIDFLVPFSKIPLAAVDTAFFRYSPVGVGRVLRRLGAARAAKAEGKEFTGRFKTAVQFGRDTAELYRQSIVGTLAWATLGLLGSMGYIAFTGGGDEDDRAGGAVREALGEKYTPEMIVGDTGVDVGRLGAVGQAAALGGRVSEAFRQRYNKGREAPEGLGRRLGRAAAAGVEGVALDTPLGRGAEDVFKALKQAKQLPDEREEAGAGEIAAAIGGQFLSSKARALVPGIVREAARMTDDTKRIPDDASPLGRIRGDIQSGLPSLRRQMQPRLDALGRPVEETSPFALLRSLRRDAQLEDLKRLDVGLSKPQREQGETANEYNQRLRARGEQFQETLRGIREDEDMRGASADARRAVYEKSLKPQAMERAGKLSDGSIRVERQIEALRGDAYAALRSIPEYEKLSAKDQKAVRDLINTELERFKATASSVSRGRFRREKRARVPDWTPAELARAAVGARR